MECNGKHPSFNPKYFTSDLFLSLLVNDNVKFCAVMWCLLYSTGTILTGIKWHNNEKKIQMKYEIDKPSCISTFRRKLKVHLYSCTLISLKIVVYNTGSHQRLDLIQSLVPWDQRKNVKTTDKAKWYHMIENIIDLIETNLENLHFQTSFGLNYQKMTLR